MNQTSPTFLFPISYHASALFRILKELLKHFLRQYQKMLKQKVFYIRFRVFAWIFKNELPDDYRLEDFLYVILEFVLPILW